MDFVGLKVALKIPTNRLRIASRYTASLRTNLAPIDFAASLFLSPCMLGNKGSRKFYRLFGSRRLSRIPPRWIGARPRPFLTGQGGCMWNCRTSPSGPLRLSPLSVGELHRRTCRGVGACTSTGRNSRLHRARPNNRRYCNEVGIKMNSLEIVISSIISIENNNESAQNDNIFLSQTVK